MLLRTIGAAALGLLLLASPAAAQYGGGGDGGTTTTTPAGGDQASTSDSSVSAGQVVTISAQCFLPGSTVTFTDGRSFNGTGTADSSGVASVQYTVPPGNEPITITASGTGCDGGAQVLDVHLTREPGAPTATGGADLPRTGDDSSLPLSRLGMALVAAGGAVAYVARRRQHAA